MKKAGITVGAIIVWALLVFGYTYISSDKLVCKSDQGDITIMYNNKTITGYSANGVSYDLDGQSAYAEYIGVSNYIQEFSEWFSTHTTGSCVQK